MKVQAKDDIIYRLMLSLKRDNVSSINTDEEMLFLINKGWIEALEWVLNLKVNDEKDGSDYKMYDETKIKYYLHEIVEAVDLAIGDDGLRSKEVIAILEEENNE